MESRQMEQEQNRINMMKSVSVSSASSPMARSFSTYQNKPPASTQSTVHEEMEQVDRTPVYDDEETNMSVHTEDSMDFLIDDPVSVSNSNITRYGIDVM